MVMLMGCGNDDLNSNDSDEEENTDELNAGASSNDNEDGKRNTAINCNLDQ